MRNRIRDHLEIIQSQLFHIKILLVVLIAVIILDYYNSIDKAILVVSWAALFLVVGFFVLKIVERIYLPKKKIDRKLKMVIDTAQAEKKDKQSK